MGASSAYDGSIRPRHYQLSISSIRYAPAWRFKGSVIITAVAKATHQIRFHASGLAVSKVCCMQLDNVIYGIQSTLTASDVAVYDLPESLQPGRVEIIIDYEGNIGNGMSGFFRAKYKNENGDDVFLLATQFEPCYARTALPCFDEPSSKASFDLQLEVPRHLTALSNMPLKTVTDIPGDQGLKRVLFERSPKMSTYLFAWAIGELEYIESVTKQHHDGSPVTVRVYTPIGLLPSAHFALKVACEILDLYKRLFKIDYPLPKCDHLVVPEFVCGAMENFGLITYKPTKILFDNAASSHRVKSKAAYVIAHELGHQWFGNLVTMTDWSELWLNEGFATWAGYMAVDELFPEWHIWGQYVAETVDDTLKIDSLPTTHTIKAEVATEEEALQMFDSISYFKGSSVIRMLVDYIGQDTFLEGLSSYLTENSYGNASSQDLWRAMSRSSGQDIGSLMQAWIHRSSFPIVTVSAKAESVSLRQSNVLRSSDIQPSASSTISGSHPCHWKIPLGLFSADSHPLVLSDDQELEVPRATLSILNRGHSGSYSVAYDSEALQSILRHQHTLSSADLAGLVADMSTMFLVGIKSIDDLLGLIFRFKNNADVYLWLSIIRTLDMLCGIFSADADASKVLRSFAGILLRSMQTHQKRLSKATDPRLSYKKHEMEKNMYWLAALASDTEMLEQARTKFQKDPSTRSIPPHLRTVVLSACLSEPESSAFSQVLTAFHNEKSVEGRESLLTALGATTDPDLATQLLDVAFCDNSTIDLQHLHILGGALGKNGQVRSLQWQYIKRHWEPVLKRLNENGTVRDWFLEASLGHFADVATARDIKQFFATRGGVELAKPLGYVVANIERNARCAERSRGGLRSFVKTGLCGDTWARI